MRSFTSGKMFNKALLWTKEGAKEVTKETITPNLQWVPGQVESGIDKVDALATKAVYATVKFVNRLSRPSCSLSFLADW
jgi:hypothetical protein